jgi:NADH-quinone oxidoreductase subunit L
LHVWLPDSMEGPTPISALIHAATMVTAGIFMVARMSPLFEYSETALSLVLCIGATTAFFMGLLGVVSNDIKRVVAYSTLSQLGYMTVALGVSAYGAAVFHLMTHAFFKALLFLAAGSVIIGMHHEQDMRRMGGLSRFMPITAITCWIGALALIGTPFLSGFYSKDAIIEAVGASNRWGAQYAYFCVMAGVFVTALYTFRMIFMTFHGKPRFEAHGEHVPHESPWVVTVPLIALAIPSLCIGFITVGSVLFGDYFAGSIFVLAANDVVGELAQEFHGALAFGLHALMTPPFYLALAGVIAAWLFFLRYPQWAEQVAQRAAVLRRVLENKYYFDWFNDNILSRGVRGLGAGLWRRADQGVIDNGLVNGTASTINWLGGYTRLLQSGYLYSYAFWMILGLVALLTWFLFGPQGAAR